MAGFRQVLQKAQLDAARESAEALTRALGEAQAKADALKGPPTPSQAATNEVKRLAREAAAATKALDAMNKAQAKALGGFSSGLDASVSKWSTITPAGGGKKAKTSGDATAKATAANEKAVKDAAKDSGGGAVHPPKDIKYLLKHAGVGKAAMGAAGAAGGLELTKLALGMKGMAQLGQITARAGLNIKRLFVGIDSAPAIRAADRFFQIFDARTSSGKAIAGIMKSIFDSVFAGVERAQPYVSEFFKGMIGAALEVQGAWLDLRIALVPVQVAIENLLGPIDGLEGAADLGKVAFVGLGAAALVAAAPMAAVAAGLGATVAALEQLSKLIKEIEAAGGISGAMGDISRAGWSGEGDSNRAYLEGRQAFEDAEKRRKESAARKDSPGTKTGLGPSVLTQNADPTVAKSAGQTIGEMWAAGVTAGVDAGMPAMAAAGARGIGAVDAGARQKGDIRSPSGLARDTAYNYPLGAAEGIDAGKSVVQAAADRSMVPQMGGAVTGTPAGGGAGRAVHVTVNLTMTGSGKSGDDAEAGVWRAMRAAVAELGGSLVPA